MIECVQLEMDFVAYTSQDRLKLFRATLMQDVVKL